MKLNVFATLNILLNDLKIASLRQCDNVYVFQTSALEFDINYVAPVRKNICGEKVRSDT